MKKFLLLFVLLSSLSLYSQNWIPLTSGSTDQIWSIDYVDANNVWFCAKAGGVFRTTNGGSTWVAAGNAGQGAYSIAALSATTAVVALGPDAGDGKLMRTTNGGTTWTQVYTAAGCWFNFVDNINSTTLWAQSDPISAVFHLVKSTDGGATWALTSNRPAQSGSETGANGSFYRIGNTCWFGTGSGTHIYKSTNGPDGPWTMQTHTTTSSGTVAFGSTDGFGVAGYWSTAVALGRTTNGGAAWSNIVVNWGTAHSATNSDWVPGTSSAWISTSNSISAPTAGFLYRSTDNGATWAVDLTATTGMNVVRIWGDINYAMAGGWNGVLYKSTRAPIIVPVEFTTFTAAANNGSVTLNWATATETNNKGFEVQRKTNNSEFVNVGYVSGNGTSTNTHNYTFTEKVSGGNYTYRLRQVDFNGQSEYSSAVEVYVAPVEFSLDQNYPNPFNPTTNINFNVAKTGLVKISVYNMLGQMVQTLVNEVKDAGSYTVNFNASGLSSGTYFYKLETPEFSKTMKMILNK